METGHIRRGADGEERAARHLRERGWSLLARNWRCPAGEIDIVAVRGDDVAIVEVKTRRALGYGHPFEAITPRKLARLRALAAEWSRRHPESVHGRRLRIDAIAVLGARADEGRVEHLEGLG